MKIVADENIPSLHAFFDRFGEVVALPGRHLHAEQVRDADILLVRSVTNVNEPLLAGSRVKFVGTCTIGTDHLDKEYLQRNHIAYASAPGCNAGGVVQYVLGALARLAPDWQTRTVGVIGSGNVGGRLCKALLSIGVDCVAYDPFVSVADNPVLTDLHRVLARDIVCVHTPYTTAGPHPSHHMLNAETLNQLKPGAILLNGGRGGAIDNSALLQHLRNGRELQVVLDVWEDEPEIDLALLEQVVWGSPHIAGYSYEGRLNGSAMIFSALVDYLALDGEVYSEQRYRIMKSLKGEPVVIQCRSFNEAILATYDIRQDDARFRQSVTQAAPDRIGAAFDLLRKTYPQRREFSHYRVQSDDAQLCQALSKVGFLVDEE